MSEDKHKKESKKGKEKQIKLNEKIEEKPKDESDSDLENLKQVSQKYKQSRAALKLKHKDEKGLSKINKSEDEIPIKKKEDVMDMNSKWALASQTIIKNPEPGQTSKTFHTRKGLSVQSSTANAMQQTLALGIFDKTESGAYKIPLSQHKNYPHAIRLYVGNLPDIFDKEDFLRFFLNQMTISGALLEPGQPIVLVQPQLDKKFLFAQFRSIEETTAAMNLDGITYNGKVLRLRRVKDYEQLPKVEGERPVPKLEVSKLAFQKISTMVSDGPLKLYVAGLAPEMEEEGLITLLSSYGQLKSLHIVRERVSNVSKGYAFCEFSSEQEANNCITILNNKTINGRTLQIKRGMPVNLTQMELGGKPNTQPHQIDTITIQEQQEWDAKLAVVQRMKTSCVLRLLNMIRVDEIEDDTEYYFVKKDIRREMEKIGKLVSFVVPRKKDNHSVDAVGRVYLEYEHENYAMVGYLLLQGKQYDGIELRVEFYDAHLYADKIY